MSGSTKKKAAKKAANVKSGPSFIEMTVKAISQTKDKRNGASRQAIANYIKSNYNKEGGALFNSHLRRALKTAFEKSIIKYGSTQQRYKLGDNVKSLDKKPKKKVGKKKPVKKAAKKKKTKKQTKKSKAKSKSKTKPKKKKPKTKKKKTSAKRKPTKKASKSKNKTSKKTGKK